MTFHFNSTARAYLIGLIGSGTEWPLIYTRGSASRAFSLKRLLSRQSMKIETQCNLLSEILSRK